MRPGRTETPARHCNGVEVEREIKKAASGCTKRQSWVKNISERKTGEEGERTQWNAGR